MGNFGSKHLLGLLWVFSLIAVMLIILLSVRKKKGYGRSFDIKVIAGSALFIWMWEIIKTIVIFNSPDYSGVGVYPAWMMPFHICSMALYVYWILGFRPGKFADYIAPYGFATMILVTSLILTIPDSSGIMGNLPNWAIVKENILPYQSFSYHGTLVFVPLYMVLSGYYKPHIKDTFKATIVLFVTALFAFTLNKILGVTDFMTLEFGNGNPFQPILLSNYAMYLLILASIAIGGTALILGIGQVATSIKMK
ncbi:MAG: YwaF family protein [Candidatus Izemoplasmatales bacterium]|nr:YwaF family protein [bacterium]MDZ4196653.1 YwaF family protein [Candidatus Izemoplasmatales bacterium]